MRPRGLEPPWELSPTRPSNLLDARGYFQEHLDRPECISGDDRGERGWLARSAPRDSRVVLFGSHARGEADEGSEYDILVIEAEVTDAARRQILGAEKWVGMSSGERTAVAPGAREPFIGAPAAARMAYEA